MSANTPFDYYASRQHAHDHAHDAPALAADDEGPPSEYEIMSRAMQELLEEKGVITADEIRRRMETFEEDFPYRGSRVIARAWVDAEFRKRLIADGKAACAEMGIELLSESQYRDLQKLGEFDTKTSSWVQTPPEIRKLGGALFCDRRYDHVFTYHNGAESYYAARGFRGALKV